MKFLGSPRSVGGNRQKRVYYNPYTKKIELKKLNRIKKEEKIEAKGYFQKNEKKIDNEWFGAKMEDEPESKATRFLFNNCQSLDFNYKVNFGKLAFIILRRALDFSRRIWSALRL